MLEGDNSTQELGIILIDIIFATVAIGLIFLVCKFKDHPWMVKIGIDKVVNSINFFNTKGKEMATEQILKELKTREVRIEFIESKLSIEEVREYREKISALTDEKIADLTVKLSNGEQVDLKSLV